LQFAQAKIQSEQPLLEIMPTRRSYQQNCRQLPVMNSHQLQMAEADGQVTISNQLKWVSGAGGEA
jgi:hypothetical protein